MYDATMEKISNKILWQSKLINLCLSSSRVNTILFFPEAPELSSVSRV